MGRGRQLGKEVRAVGWEPGRGARPLTPLTSANQLSQGCIKLGEGPTLPVPGPCISFLWLP